MVCLGLEPVEAGWKAQTNPLAAPLYLIQCYSDIAAITFGVLKLYILITHLYSRLRVKPKI